MKNNPITHSFLIICLVVSIPSSISDEVFNLLSAELPHEHWWQSFTSPFLHGAPGNPIAVLGHLFLNMILLLTCGKWTEQLIGSKRFFVLTIIAWLGFSLTQYLSGYWINGSSGIIWTYSPFLLIIINKAKITEYYQNIADQAKGLLIIMWGIITVVMGFVPLLFNPNHSLIHTFFYGNLFHLSATLVGFVFYFLWRKDYSE